MKILHILYDEVDNPWFGGGAAIRNQEVYKRMVKENKIIDGVKVDSSLEMNKWIR